MNLKKISIITLTKNNLNELILTINSIIEQKINVLIELIIVDGSVNKKLLIQTLKSFEEIFYQKNILLKYINSFEKNIHGIYPSMNLAMDYLNSDYLIFMNSGDTFYDLNSLNLLFNNIETYKCDVCFGQSLITFKESSWLTPSKYVNNIKNWCKLFEPIHQSILVKTDLAVRIKYDEKSEIGADAKWKREIINNNHFKYIPLPVSNFSLNGISNKISFKTLRIKIKEPSRRKLEKILEILKFLFFKLGFFGPNTQKLKSFLIGIIF
tara:strand:+ start:900 stop:1700 length:801 start_codon:yes stop_codon:yes gene_type:complete